jgi:tyrosine-protein kinase Etk/Wzc
MSDESLNPGDRQSSNARRLDETTASAKGEELDQPIDFGAAALEIWARRKTVLICGFAVLVVAALIAFLWPPYYAATASFIPPEFGSSTSSTMSASLSALGAASLLGPIKNSDAIFISILKSRTVSDRMIDRFELMKVYHKKKRSLAAKALENASRFETDAKSSVISIKVTDKNPERARNMANAYLEEMRSESGGLALTESSQRRLFFEQQLAKEKDDLANAEVALKQSQETTGLISPSGQTNSKIQEISQTRAQITGLELQLASLSQGATDQNPEIVRIKSEIGSLQAQLAQMENGKNKQNVLGPSTSQVPALELEYIRKMRDVKYHETLFNIIAKQYETARLDEANSSPILQVLDQATTPDMKAGPPRGIIMASGLFLGLLGGSLWVLFQARLRESQV